MVFMMRAVEAADAKMFNVFPLRTSIIPGHIRIDTTTLMTLMFIPNPRDPTYTLYSLIGRVFFFFLLHMFSYSSFKSYRISSHHLILRHMSHHFIAIRVPCQEIEKA